MVPNGFTNGVNGHASPEPPSSTRFTDIPRQIEIPVSGADNDEAVEVDLVNLLDDTDELCTLLENENVARSYWMIIALAYAKQKKIDHGIEILNKGLGALQRGKNEDKLSMLACLCWLYLWKCREAPRLKPEGQLASEARTKEFYISAATSTLNDASRISPSYPPLFLARGVLYLLRASLQSSRAGAGQDAERVDTLRQASKCFDDALRTSSGRNVMAVMGKARALYSLGKYADALHNYQSALERAPDLVDPDPRIGIGCCFWQLGYKEPAKVAWERAQELVPDSRIANQLLGLYHMDESSQFSTKDTQFVNTYRKAMAYINVSFKQDNTYALSCAGLGGYFLLRKSWNYVEQLARRAIERTDVNAIASDGWYLLARKEHYEGDMAKASEYYGKADQARGGDEKGYLPAKFGAAQLKTLMQDFDGAKFRLEKIVGQSKSIEAMTLLGLLYAEEVFTNQDAGNKEDKSTEQKKAISLLESVRVAWKDTKRRVDSDSSVLLNLARLYETEQPEKSLQCLLQVEVMDINDIPQEDRPEDIDNPEELNAVLREYLAPQLLNNIGCFYYQAEKCSKAREYFQTGLTASTRLKERDGDVDTDPLVTTMTFNYARTLEALGMGDEAKAAYEGLIIRHPDYVDANTRLTYISLRQSPSEGAEAIKQLFEADQSNLEVRALYGWYISRAKKRTPNIAEDQEQRHYKHTLQHYDKHDRYSLVGMGNLYLAVAREMRRDTDKEKDSRSKMYMKAVEFFDKALQLDARNAYAAQGLGIAMVEDKKDFSTAIQIFSKIRETLKETSVFINLGHAFCEVKQYSRAIENYEAALAKDRAHDPQILACLGRVWLLRGKQEKSVAAMKTSMEYSQQALKVAPDQTHFKFNVAFVQIQIAQLIYTLPDASRMLVELEAASNGLDQAIESFSAIAKSPNPPFPRHDIEQRANMGRNTMKRQLQEAMDAQRKYEQKNAAKIEAARKAREEADAKRQAEKKRIEDEAEAKRRQIAEERQRMMEEDREMAQRRMEEEKRTAEAEFMTDEETGERKKREKKKAAPKGGKRKKKGDETDTGVDTGDEGTGKSRQRSAATSATPMTGSDAEGARPAKKKRRKLERKGRTTSSKYKSADTVEESSEEDEAVEQQQDNAALATKLRRGEGEDVADESMAEGDDEHDNDAVAARPTRKKIARILDDDDEDDEDIASPPVNENADLSMLNGVDGVTAAGNDDGGGD